MKHSDYVIRRTSDEGQLIRVMQYRAAAARSAAHET